MFSEAELEIFLTDENDNTPEFTEDFYELNVSEDLSGLEEDNNGHYLGKHIQSFFHIFKQRFMNEKVCKNIWQSSLLLNGIQIGYSYILIK